MKYEITQQQVEGLISYLISSVIPSKDAQDISKMLKELPVIKEVEKAE